MDRKLGQVKDCVIICLAVNVNETTKRLNLTSVVSKKFLRSTFLVHFRLVK